MSNISIQVVWKGSFVTALYAPWHNFTPTPSMTVTAEEVVSVERAVRQFLEVNNCREYRKVFPEAPCACGACEFAPPGVFGWEAVRMLDEVIPAYIRSLA